MGDRKRFHIPTADELEDKRRVSESFKPTNIFKSFKEQQKQEPPEESQNKKPKIEMGRDTTASKTYQTKSATKNELKSTTSLTTKGNNTSSENVPKSDAIEKFTKVSEISSKETVSTVETASKESIASTSGISSMAGIQATNAQKLAIPGKTNSLLVNQRQRGNPILKFVRNIPWEFGDIVPDYVMGQTTCALFLSLRYHQLNPNYIHERLKQLGRSYELRVLLVQIDIKEPHHLIKELAKICILADCTFILAFSTEEAGRYLETFKVYENKPPDAIMEKTEQNFMAKMTECLTNIKSVNKTDVSTLITTFGSLKGIAEASQEDLSFCPGFGPQKAKRVFDLFREPFIRGNKQKKDS